MKKISIRDAKDKRIFDVKVDEFGKILNFEVKTEKGMFKISVQELKKQIVENLKGIKNKI